MKRTISIVIPNYNGINYLKDCLEAIRLQTRQPDRVIVVDNGSSDGSVEYLRESFSETELITFPTNTGFCAAVNAGIRASYDLDYVILLNNDTKVEPDFVRELEKAMERHPHAFSAQAKMLRMTDPERMDDAGDLYCALGWAFARGKGKPETQFRRETRVFSCCAGAAIYRIPVLKEIGLFDEHHFAYLEDTDIGWRARICGYQNYFVPKARVLHVGSASSGSIYNLFKVKNTSRNSIYLISKNMPPLMILINLPFLLAGFSVKAVFFAIRGFGGEYLKGLVRGFRLAHVGRREGRVIPVKREHLGNYFRIEAELLINMIRRFL